MPNPGIVALRVQLLLPIMLLVGPPSTAEPEARDAETSAAASEDAEEPEEPADDSPDDPADDERLLPPDDETERGEHGDSSDEVLDTPAPAPASASQQPVPAPVAESVPAPQDWVDHRPRLTSFGIAALVTAGWGAIGAGLGAWLYVREDSLARDDHSELVTTQPAGIPVMIAGGAVAVLGVAAFAGEAIMVKRRRARITAAPLPGGAAVGIAGRF